MAYEDDYWTQFEPLPQTAPQMYPYTGPQEDDRQMLGGAGFVPGSGVPPGTRPGPIIPPSEASGPTAPTPQPGTPPPPGGGDLWDETRFTSQFGRPTTPQELIALEAQLNAAGITVMRNAAGVAGKIRLPNGQIIDVINAAGAGGRGFQWLTGDGGSGGGPGGDGFGDWTKPYGETYNLPTQAELEHMPGYQAGLDAYRKGIESSAASKGTLLTGGTLQRLGQAGTDYANQAYGQLAGLQRGAFETNYGIYRNNQNDPFNKYYSLAQLGRP